MRVFLDACILYSAARSRSGGSAKIISESARWGFLLLSSSVAFEEAKRNIIKDLEPSALSWLAGQVRGNPSGWELVETLSDEEIGRWRKVTVEKDLHVLAGALKGRADVLVTLDRKHLLKANVREAFPIRIMDTSEFWRAIREGEL